MLNSRDSFGFGSTMRTDTDDAPKMAFFIGSKIKTEVIASLKPARNDINENNIYRN